MELATCEFLEGAADVIIAGPVGTGKTHLAISLGVEAARRRFRVAFYRAADLVRILTEARDDPRRVLPHTQTDRGGRTDGSTNVDGATLRRLAGVAQRQNVGRLNSSALPTPGGRRLRGLVPS